MNTFEQPMILSQNLLKNLQKKNFEKKYYQNISK